MAVPHTEPTSQERWRAIGLLASVLTIAYYAVLHWWWTAPMLERQRQIGSLRSEEMRLHRIASQRPELERRMARARSLEQGSQSFLPEANAGLAMAGLVQLLEQAVPSHEGNASDATCAVTSRSPATSKSKERFGRVVLQVRMRCDMAHLTDVLYALEGGTPSIFIDNLSIRGGGVGNISAPAGRRDADQLDISFDMYGYLRQASEIGTTHG